MPVRGTARALARARLLIGRAPRAHGGSEAGLQCAAIDRPMICVALLGAGLPAGSPVGRRRAAQRAARGPGRGRVRCLVCLVDGGAVLRARITCAALLRSKLAQRSKLVFSACPARDRADEGEQEPTLPTCTAHLLALLGGWGWGWR
jgi:hypothetical protein